MPLVFSIKRSGWNSIMKIPNRSQVQGSMFRVEDKEGIEDPKSLFSPNE
jgi:hypothetical protein